MIFLHRELVLATAPLALAVALFSTDVTILSRHTVVQVVIVVLKKVLRKA